MTGFLGVTLLSLKNTFSPFNNDDISILISIYGIFDQMNYCLVACKNDVIMALLACRFIKDYGNRLIKVWFIIVEIFINLALVVLQILKGGVLYSPHGYTIQKCHWEKG